MADRDTREHRFPRRSDSARDRLVAAARELIAVRGYESLEVAEIAAAAGVSRQSFYNNFGDKRACAVATGDPELTEIDIRLREAEAQGRAWAPQLAETLERALADQHNSPDTPRARLLDALQDSIVDRGYAATRIVHLTKAAGVSRPDFYVLFADKRECLAALCGRAFAEIDRETQPLCSEGAPDALHLALLALIGAIAADPIRARMAVGQLALLPHEPPADPTFAYARTLRDLLDALLLDDQALAPLELERRIIGGALAEGIEAAVAEGRLGRLTELLVDVEQTLIEPLKRDLGEARPANGHHRRSPARRRVGSPVRAPARAATVAK